MLSPFCWKRDLRFRRGRIIHRNPPVGNPGGKWIRQCYVTRWGRLSAMQADLYAESHADYTVAGRRLRDWPAGLIRVAWSQRSRRYFWYRAVYRRGIRLLPARPWDHVRTPY